MLCIWCCHSSAVATPHLTRENLYMVSRKQAKDKRARRGGTAGSDGQGGEQQRISTWVHCPTHLSIHSNKLGIAAAPRCRYALFNFAHARAS
jgi:hypothetical protein